MKQWEILQTIGIWGLLVCAVLSVVFAVIFILQNRALKRKFQNEYGKKRC